MTRRSTPRATPGSPKAPPAPAGAPAEGSASPAAKRRPKAPPKPKAARIIAVANQKGGVGKSTTAVSVGAALAELGKRVLVVDLDPQGNASTGLGIRHEARDVTVYDVLAAEAPIHGAIVATPVPGLFAIPSTIDLAGAEIELVSQFSRELRLRKALEPLGEDPYDFVFLDCPPSLGLLTVNALAAARELIVPIQCEYYALEGLGQLLRNVGLVQQNVNPDLRLTGIVMTMYDPRTKLSEQVVEEVRRYFGKRVYKTVIPRTVRLSEAPGFGQPITVYDPKSRGAECYRSLAKEVVSKLPIDAPLPSFDSLRTVVATPPEPEPMHAPRALLVEAAPPEPEAPVAEAQSATVEPEPAQPEPATVEPETAREALHSGAEAEAPVGSAPTPAVEPVARVESEPEVEPKPEPEVPSKVEHPDRGHAPALETQAAPDVEAPESQEPTSTLGPVISESEATSEVEAPPADLPAAETAAVVPEAGPGAEDLAGGLDVDEAEEAFIALHEAEARGQDESAEPSGAAPPVREIDLEPEAEDGVEPSEVVRIADRDAAGDHEPAGEGSAEGPEDVGKRRWSLFRRGGSR